MRPRGTQKKRFEQQESEICEEAKRLAAKVQKIKEEREAADAEIRMQNSEAERLEAEWQTHQVQDDDQMMVEEETATVPVRVPPAINRLPAGQSVLEPRETKNEEIPSESKEVEDTKTLHSQGEDAGWRWRWRRKR